MRGGAGPFPEVLRAGFGPVSEALRGRGAKQDNPKFHISPQCGERLCRWYLHGRGSGFTHPRVGQAEHLACRKRPPNAFSGRSPHPLRAVSIRCAQARGRQAGGNPCRGRVTPVCRVWSGGKGGAPETGIPAALGRVWTKAGGREDLGNPAPLKASSISEKEHLQRVTFPALWRRSILVLG